MENLSALTTVLTTYGSWVGLASLFCYMLFTRKKRLAETTEMEVRTAIELNNTLKKEIERLRHDVSELRRALDLKEFKIEDLSSQISLIDKQCPQCPLKNFKAKKVMPN